MRKYNWNRIQRKCRGHSVYKAQNLRRVLMSPRPSIMYQDGPNGTKLSWWYSKLQQATPARQLQSFANKQTTNSSKQTINQNLTATNISLKRSRQCLYQYMLRHHILFNPSVVGFHFHIKKIEYPMSAAHSCSDFKFSLWECLGRKGWAQWHPGVTVSQYHKI